MSDAGTEGRRVTRRSHANDAQPSLDDIEGRIANPEDVLEGGDNTEGQVSDAARVLKDAENDALRARLATAEGQLSEKDKELDKAQRVTASAQENQIRTAVTAAKEALSTAKVKYQTARNAGDVDAETEAQVAISMSASALREAESTLGRFETWKKQQAEAPRRPVVQQQQQDAEPTPEARKWLSEHPLYYADDGYRATALAAHEGALGSGLKDGSKEYIDFIEQKMVKAFGSDHGQIKREASVKQRPRSSEGAPPARGNDSQDYRGSGDLSYRDPATGDTLRLITGVDANGRPYETVQGTIPAEWREYARIAGFKDEKDRSGKVIARGDVKYAVEQLRIRNDPSLAGLSTSTSGVYK